MEWLVIEDKLMQWPFCEAEVCVISQGRLAAATNLLQVTKLAVDVNAGRQSCSCTCSFPVPTLACMARLSHYLVLTLECTNPSSSRRLGLFGRTLVLACAPA